MTPFQNKVNLVSLEQHLSPMPFPVCGYAGEQYPTVAGCGDRS